jgi:hypothetical protein
MIEGHPTMSAHLLMALIRKSGGKILESESTKERAMMKAQRADGEIMTVEWKMEEAAGVSVKEGDKWVKLSETARYKNYPTDMLWARCASRLYRRLFSDAAYGATLYVPEDFGMTDAEATEATVFTDEAIAEAGVMMGLTEFVPRPADGEPMGELVKKELLAKVMRQLNLPPWRECTTAQQAEAIALTKVLMDGTLAALSIEHPENAKLALDFDQAKAIFDLVRDGVMPATEEVAEGEIVDSGEGSGQEIAPTPQNGDVVDAEVVEPAPRAAVDVALEEQRWTELAALLELDLTSGTNPVSETRTRALYRLMRDVGLWADDQLHIDLAAWGVQETGTAFKHYTDLGKKADRQAFALAIQKAAKATYLGAQT